MSQRRRPFLAAVMSPEASYVISRGLGAKIEELAAAQPEWLRRKVLASLEQMRESGLQWQEGLHDEQAGERGEEVDEPVGRELTVSEAAAVLGVSVERVRKLARLVKIDGRRVRGREWLLDEVSVLDYRDRRRDAAS